MIPLTLVTLLVVASVGAGLLAEIAHSGPTSESRVAQGSLFAIVGRTTKVSSFRLLAIPGPTSIPRSVTYYQAPDRTMDVTQWDSSGNAAIMTTIGANEYSAVLFNGKLVDSVVIHNPVSSFANQYAMGYLQAIYRFGHVRQDGSSFVATSTQPPDVPWFALLLTSKATHGANGSTTVETPFVSWGSSKSGGPTFAVSIRVTVSHGYVASEYLTARGPFNFPDKGISVRHAKVSYTLINNTISVVPPTVAGVQAGVRGLDIANGPSASGLPAERGTNPANGAPLGHLDRCTYGGIVGRFNRASSYK
jgi:hypothetical protein